MGQDVEAPAPGGAPPAGGGNQQFAALQHIADDLAGSGPGSQTQPSVDGDKENIGAVSSNAAHAPSGLASVA